jgi:replicative DNA helicase
MLEPQGLPTSIHTEVATLGLCLQEPAAVTETISRLTPDDFFLDAHKRIYRAILSVVGRGMVADLTTVRGELERGQEMSAVGGIAYLMSLTEGTAAHASIDSYIQTVKEYARRRQFIGIHHEGYGAGLDPSLSSAELITESLRQLQELAESDTGSPMLTAGEFLKTLGHDDAIIESLATVDGLKLGWTQFDEITGGLQRGELAVVAAFTGLGKTAWGCNTVHNVTVGSGKTAVYFPLEDKRRHAIRRMLAAASGLNYREIREGKLRSYERDLFRDHHRALSAAPLYMDDSNGLTMARIKSKSLQVKRTTGNLDLIVIDQLSHVEDSDVFVKNSTGEERLGKQAKAAKNMAEDCDCPVILLHQLTQESAKRANPRPMLTDLGGSGKIKNHADIVAFLHRAEYFDRSNDLVRGKGELIIAKARSSRTDDCEMEWDGSIQKWTDPKAATPVTERIDWAQNY